jgi:hypothetical protein
MPSATVRDVFRGGPWSVVALAAVVCFLGAIWLFGWNRPARSDLEGLLKVAFALNTSLDAWASDGNQKALTQGAVALVGEILCRSRSKRRQPTIHYECLYDLTGLDGGKYRLILGADHNMGWRRLGMADFGNYRLVDIPVERQKAILADYDT